ncbi:dihydrolipoamide branched chain transacylase E2 [Reticulomyxa filosa]|uniref:Dihydrolipoamide branched chain transacylase E2 n=1 Tax=Reticulomyxa filosa TaxID=46433 RepID=X6NR14_RETFI|nr:dihydrolipoamide branched chain transacylase E2 [Reticulomyxa filosa]|eukprot:ETO27792.1 dihydrolipoamide branched chain transacylase E2 [Reticulomyxa filosa]
MYCFKDFFEHPNVLLTVNFEYCVQIDEFYLHFTSSNIFAKKVKLCNRQKAHIDKLKQNKNEQRPQLQYVYGIHRNFSQSVKTFMCPEPGEGTVEVKINEWLIKPGDKVKDGDEVKFFFFFFFNIPFFPPFLIKKNSISKTKIGTASYEKADFVIYAPYDGIVHEFCVKAGGMATVHKPLIKFEVAAGEGKKDHSHGAAGNEKSKGDETKKSLDDKSSQSANASASASASASSNPVDIKALPAARKLAKEHGVDLASIKATGSHGHVLKEDVLAFVEQLKSHPVTTTAAATTTTTTTTATPKASVQSTKIKLPTLLDKDFVVKLLLFFF